jgi:uncharacterized damage-inducible protein DinB
VSDDAVRAIILRELRAFRREVEAYPDDASVWRNVPGLPNSGGTLALHVAGNLRHFVGSILGRDGYRRDREAEFARRNVPRSELIEGIDAAMVAVERGLDTEVARRVSEPYPEKIGNRQVTLGAFLVHLASHLAYHLGQIDYHRRAVTGDARPVDAVSVRELPEAKP